MSHLNSVFQRGSRTAALYQFCWVLSLGWTVQGFQVHFKPSVLRVLSLECPRKLALRSSNEIVDVEFERNPDPEEDVPKKKNKSAKKKKKKTGKKKKGSAKSLFEMSLELEPRWKDTRIPFVDTARTTCIDGTLAFLVELEGVRYGIAVPCDAAAAITLENTDGSVTNMYPDDDDNEELMEIMAAQLVEHVGPDLALKRTPRVLTIQGDLDQYTKNWEKEILPMPYEAKEILENINDEDDDLTWAHEFFKKELGEEEYEKTMAEPVTAEDVGDELMELFDIAGFGERSDDMKGIEELFQSLENQEDPTQAALDTLGSNPLDHEGAALKLISYLLEDGKSYSLVQLLKPYTLVGRLADIDDKKSLEFELLTQEEEKVVVPKLEELCRKDLEEAGLDLSP